MRRIIFSVIVLIIILTYGCKPGGKQETDNRIVAGTIDSLFSKTLNEERKIWVYLPEEDNLFTKQSYPVVYLLDGDAHFFSVMSLVQQLSEVNMNMILPRMIVIGITNTDRTRDLTPSHVTTDGDIPDSSFFSTSGGAENFTAFIEDELIPFVDSNYPTSPYRVLIGHSYGGLFTINTLLNHTRLFNGYIAIDPTMSYDKNKLLKQAEKILAEKDFKGASFYLTIANQGYSDTDTSKENAASFELARLLDLNKGNNLVSSWHYYKDDNHGSVPPISEYDGLRFIFDFYNPRLPYKKFRDPSYKVDSFVVAHFDKVSINMGYKVSPPESLVNWLGYLFIMEKQLDKSSKLFKINIDNYPSSPNVYDSMGEVCILQGDTINAILNYEKSLKLNPSSANAKMMIERLKK